MHSRKVTLLCLFLFLAAGLCRGEESSGGGMFGKTIEELMQMKVSLVSRQEETIFDSPAAVYVITDEAIKRSGHTSIPELLRLVPGMQVARISSSRWAIGVRGFQDEFSNKLLVQMDGRSVYSPFYSGVYWDAQDYILDDLSHIEVVRGPGGALWGANAVNGIINIVSKKAEETQGQLVSAGVGSFDKGIANLRYGGELADDVFYRVYGRYVNRDNTLTAMDEDVNDAWHMMRAGFRIDSSAFEKTALTLQGDIYVGEIDATTTLPLPVPPYRHSTDEEHDAVGGNILLRLKHEISDTSDMTAQIYYDRTERDTLGLHEDRDTIDFDFQHRMLVGDINDLVWGVGYRSTMDHYTDSFSLSSDDLSESMETCSIFLNDEIQMIYNKLKLVLGAKLESNSYTHEEFQPSGKILWKPTEKQTVWGAVSRAVRTPSRFDNSFYLNTAVVPSASGVPSYIRIVGQDNLKSDELIAYEFGYRLHPVESISLDFAGFIFDYENLISLRDGTPFFEADSSGGHMVIPTYVRNGGEAMVSGAECSMIWQVTDAWRLSQSYSWLEFSFDPIKARNDREEPRHRYRLSSLLELTNNIDLDTHLYYVSDHDSWDVDEYVRWDLRIGWDITDNVEFSIVGQNLLDDRHAEAKAISTGAADANEIPRSVFASLSVTL